MSGSGLPPQQAPEVHPEGALGWGVTPLTHPLGLRVAPGGGGISSWDLQAAPSQKPLQARRHGKPGPGWDLPAGGLCSRPRGYRGGLATSAGGGLRKLRDIQTGGQESFRTCPEQAQTLSPG